MPKKMILRPNQPEMQAVEDDVWKLNKIYFGINYIKKATHRELPSFIDRIYLGKQRILPF